jgi:hypothetical protein
MINNKHLQIAIFILLLPICILKCDAETAGIGGYGTFIISNISGKYNLEITGDNLLGAKLMDSAGVQEGDVSLNKVGQLNRWQKWLISKQANGFYKIMNLYSGKYLTALAGNDKSGLSIVQYHKTLEDAQYWIIKQLGGNKYEIINKKNLQLLSRKAGYLNGPLVLNNNAQDDTKLWKITPIAPDSYRDDEVVRFFQRTVGSDAFDEGSSIPLYSNMNKGEVLWVTGDTFYNQVDSKGEFSCNLIFPYHNSVLLQPADHSWDPAKTKNLISKDGAQVFNPSNPKSLFWPGAGVEIGDKIYVHNIEVVAGTLNTVNQYLGVITESPDTNISPVKMVEVPGMSGQTAIVYTIGMVKPAGQYIYAYGLGGMMAANIYVARFRPESPTKWTFWNGETWAAKPSTSAEAVVAKGPVNNNGVGYVNGKYVLITMDFGFTCDGPGKNMYSSISDSPTGPFIHKKLIYSVPDYKQGHSPVFYNPTVHAEFDNGHRELLIAYCLNFYNKNDKGQNTCLTPCSNPDGSMDPNDYRIKGIRVPYSLMGL